MQNTKQILEDIFSQTKMGDVVIRQNIEKWLRDSKFIGYGRFEADQVIGADNKISLPDKDVVCDKDTPSYIRFKKCRKFTVDGYQGNIIADILPEECSFLNIVNCNKIKNLEGCSCRISASLRIEGCKALTTLKGIDGIIMDHPAELTISIRNCGKINDVSGLPDAYQILISDCASLKEIDYKNKCNSLVITRLDSLNKISKLSDNLNNISITYCPSLDNIDFMPSKVAYIVTFHHNGITPGKINCKAKSIVLA